MTVSNDTMSCRPDKALMKTRTCQAFLVGYDHNGPMTASVQSRAGTCCPSPHPALRLRDVAEVCDITERTAHRIVGELVDQGYLVKSRNGTRNRYEIRPDVPIHDVMLGEHWVGEILAVLAGQVARQQADHLPLAGQLAHGEAAYRRLSSGAGDSGRVTVESSGRSDWGRPRSVSAGAGMAWGRCGRGSDLTALAAAAPPSRSRCRLISPRGFRAIVASSASSRRRSLRMVPFTRHVRRSSRRREAPTGERRRAGIQRLALRRMRKRLTWFATVADELSQSVTTPICPGASEGRLSTPFGLSGQAMGSPRPSRKLPLGVDSQCTPRPAGVPDDCEVEVAPVDLDQLLIENPELGRRQRGGALRIGLAAGERPQDRQHDERADQAGYRQPSGPHSDSDARLSPPAQAGASALGGCAAAQLWTQQLVDRRLAETDAPLDALTMKVMTGLDLPDLGVMGPRRALSPCRRRRYPPQHQPGGERGAGVYSARKPVS